jgi:23S rRNA (uracil1939-C5)-methyltransferase
MEQYNIAPYDEENHTGLVRHILTRVGATTGEVLVCLIINGKSLPKSDVLAERLKEAVEQQKLTLKGVCLNVNREKTNVILGTEIIPVWGNTYITDYIGDVSFRISPLSFYQVNPKQTKVLYEKALEFAGLTGNEIVWDLYCGIGTISLFLAKKAKQVYGVEIVPQAIEDAKQNAIRNSIANAEFFVGAAEDVLPAKYRESGGMRADVIVVDPPRKGCDETLLQTVVNMEPKRVVYVSCDPATLARDVKYLEENGYKLVKAQPVDMFPFTEHVETVALLVKM